jgi:hypothetical protein
MLTPTSAQEGVASATPSATDIAWAAGLFDGEGSFTLSRRFAGQWRAKTDRFYARASLQMADHETVARFARIMGGGKVYACAISQKHHRPTLKWDASQRHMVEQVVALLGPHLSSEKLVKALNVLAADSREDTA